MKTALAIVVVIAVILVGGYFGLPVMIEKEMQPLRTDIQDVKQRLELAEKFVQSEEEIRKQTQLKPDSDLQSVIKTVNAASLRIASLEDSLKNNFASSEETLSRQKASTEEAFRKQAESIDKSQKDFEARLQKVVFDASMASIRGHILKARTDLLYKNIGTAKAEIDLISDTLEKLKKTAAEDHRKIIDELQVVLKKAKAEVDADLPSAINKMDLLWHEMSKLLKKA